MSNLFTLSPGYAVVYMVFHIDVRFGSKAAAHYFSTWAAGFGQQRTLIGTTFSTNR
jgi:hypothetical protein